MIIRLWKGYHSPSLEGLVQKSWEEGALLILCPPLLKDFQFIPLLPEGDIEFWGDWDLLEKERAAVLKPSAKDYPEQPVLGVFSSGTVSGDPRLILYSKKNIEISLDSILSVFDRNRIRKVFCYPQAFHTFGLLLGYVLSYLNKFELITAFGRYSTQAHQLRIAADSEDLMTLGTPTHLRDLIQFAESQSHKALKSYTCILGGAAVSVDLWKQLRSEIGIQAPSIGYGATEASPGITHLAPGHEPLEDGEIGYPLRHLNVRIEPGRGIEVRGESVCLAIIQGGQVEFPDRLLIEDWIEARKEGVLLYRGRHGLILNRGGEKFPLELMEQRIQNALKLEVLCMAVPHSRLGEDLAVLLKSAEKGDGNRSRIREYLQQQWGIGFSLDHFVGVDELPMNSSSKVDRKKAVEMVLQRERG